MFKPLARSAVLKYFTTESQEKPREIFERVHLPIDKIRVEFCQEGSHGEFANESEVAGWVLDVDGTAWRNRIFSFVGETGSGKSEFCQYLQYRAGQSRHHIPILISRSTTRLTEIVRLLNEHAGLDEDGEMTEVTDLNEAHIVAQSVAYVMRVTLTKQFKNRYTESQLQGLERAFQRESFKALLSRSFAEYKAQVMDDGKERQLNLLNRKEFDLLFGNTLPWLDLDSAYVTCRDQINEGVKALVQLGNMSGRLHHIAQRYKALNKRPLLIMEDLTSFGFMKEELLDYLFELNSGNFDVVIGWTTGFEAENLGSIFRTEGDGFTYMRERLRGRFAMTDAQRTSWFLEHNHVAMMARYIHASRSDSGLDYPPDDLYPVNSAFVSNVYNRLIDDDKQPKKTPRLLLRTMQAILARSNRPWLTATDLVGQMLAAKHLPDRLFNLEAEYPDEVRFLEWYGSPVDGKVSRRDAARLGVDLPPELSDFLTDVDPAPVIVTPDPEPESQMGIDTKPQGQSQSQHGGAPVQGNQPVSVKPVPEKVTPPPQTTEKPDPLAKEKLDVQQWLQGGDFTLRRTAEKGLGALLAVYGDVSGIGNSRSHVTPVLAYEKSKVHAVFEGTMDRPESFPQVFVPRDRRSHVHIFTALITGQTSRIREAAEDAFLKDPDLVHWLGQLYESYRSAQLEYLAERLAMSIERFVYHLYITVVGLTTGETGADIRAIVMFDPSQNPAAPELACLKTAPEVKELLRFRRTVTNLFRSFFFLNPTTLDLPLLLKVREGYSHAEFGTTLAQVAREGIDQGFWLTVDGGEAKVKDEKVLLSHLVTQCVSLDGRLKSARQEFTADRERLQETEIRTLADGLTDAELHTNLPRIEGLLSAMKRAKDEDWKDLIDPSPLDFANAAARLEAVAQAAMAATHVFEMVAAHRVHATLCAKREVKVLRTLQRLLAQLDEDAGQAEAELANKQYNNRADKAVIDCQQQWERLSTLAKEVGA